MNGKPDKPKLDALVGTSIRYFRECEEMVLAGKRTIGQTRPTR